MFYCWHGLFISHRCKCQTDKRISVNGISVMNDTCRLLIMRSGKCFLLPLLLLFAFIFMDMKLRQNSAQTKEQDSVNQFYITQPMEVLEESKVTQQNQTCLWHTFTRLHIYTTFSFLMNVKGPFNSPLLLHGLVHLVWGGYPEVHKLWGN